MRSLSLFLVVTLAVPVGLAAQRVTDGNVDTGPSRDALIESALSAAPPSVARQATVVDLEGSVVRKGDNGWVCMPDMPDVPNNAPMCLDAPWREVIDAWMHHRMPNISRVGISYMLQGDLPVSNKDPFATEPTRDNEWIQEGVPHIMIVIPDPYLLEGISTDPHNGGPWVMWKGTPYAHIMIPTVPRTK